MTFFLASDVKEIIDRVEFQLRSLDGKSILLTGAGGFLGRNILGVIDEANKTSLSIKVTGIDNFVSSGNFESFFDTLSGDWFEHVQVDICDKTAVESLSNHDIIIHAAGIASPFYYRAKPLETLEVASNATKYLLEHARKCNARFTFFSSSEIYGDPLPQFVPIKESYKGNVSCRGPRACYDESKRLGETLCYIYHEYYGVSTNIIRPFNIYGPGMQQNDYRVMPNFASQIVKGLPLEIYAGGTQTRTFCYITDAMVGFFKVFCDGLPGEPYNVGNDSPEVSINQLAEIFKLATRTQLKINITDYQDTYPQDEPQRRCPDIKKITTQLDYSAKIGLQEGVVRFLDWAKISYNMAK